MILARSRTSPFSERCQRISPLSRSEGKFLFAVLSGKTSDDACPPSWPVLAFGRARDHAPGKTRFRPLARHDPSNNEPTGFGNPGRHPVVPEANGADAAAAIRLAASVKLYELGRLSSGAAARRAGVPRVVFLSKLADYGVDTFHLTADELERQAPLV